MEKLGKYINKDHLEENMDQCVTLLSDKNQNP